jgi:hypothetical protein
MQQMVSNASGALVLVTSGARIKVVAYKVFGWFQWLRRKPGPPSLLNQHVKRVGRSIFHAKANAIKH